MKTPLFVDVGSAPNDGTGDTLHVAFHKISQNMSEIIKCYDSLFEEPTESNLSDERLQFNFREKFIELNEKFIKIFELLDETTHLREGQCKECGKKWTVSGTQGAVVSVLAVQCSCGYENK